MGRQQGSQLSHVDAEERLAEAIVSASSEVHWVFDRQRRCRYISPYAASLFQLDPAAMLGRSWRELGLPAELGAPFEEDLRRVLHGNTHITGEMVLPVCGERRQFEYILTPLETGEARVGLVMANARDVTARFATLNQVRKLNRTLSRKVMELACVNEELEAFSYSVSHDLRAPLRGLDGFSQALLEDYGEQLDDTGRDYLERIRAASQRMAQLIDDLLGLSRITRAEMTVETVDLTGMAGEILKEHQKRAPHRQVAVRIAADLTVQGDRRLLRLALENLLSNAWKFTAQAPRAEIELGVDTARQTVPVYYVRDNGAGFNMAHAERLFGPFQRLHSMQEFAGRGIGLATVRRIIQRHGGYIWADAKPQRGATFYFRLAEPDSLATT